MEVATDFLWQGAKAACSILLFDMEKGRGVTVGSHR